MGEGGALQLARLSLGCSCFVLFVVLVGTSTSTATAEQTFARANNSLFVCSPLSCFVLAASLLARSPRSFVLLR